MPINLPEIFVMAQSERAFRVPDTDARRIQAQQRFYQRSGVVFIFSAMCLLAYPGWVPLYTRPARAEVTRTDSLRQTF